MKTIELNYHIQGKLLKPKHLARGNWTPFANTWVKNIKSAKKELNRLNKIDWNDHAWKFRIVEEKTSVVG
jgi:hypothetical protein